MTVRILVGDVRTRLAELPDDHFDCVVTSPPYWGLRDYGVAGQIGLERTLGEHLAVMVDVFREVRRVLKPSGTLWLNYGDCYAASPNGRSAADKKAKGNDDRTFRDKPISTIGPILATWDRKSERKDGHNMAGGAGRASSVPNHRVVPGGHLKPKDLTMMSNRLAIALQDDGWWVRSEIVWGKRAPMPESCKDRPTGAHEKVWLLAKARRYFYDAEAVREAASCGNRFSNQVEPRPPRVPGKSPHLGLQKASPKTVGRNLRNVWMLGPDPCPEAHFAAFPSEIPRRAILAGTSEKGVCPHCGSPWNRLVRGTTSRETIGWRASCACPEHEPIPATVLDPFFGAGTTGLVAERLGRNCVGIELSPTYAAMAAERIRRDGGMLADVRTECLMEAAE